MKKILQRLERLEESIAYFFLIAGSTISVFGVVTRYVFNHPYTWTTEVFETLMVTAIFIGFGMALKDDRHIVIDLVYDRMPAIIRKAFDIISNLFGAGFSIFMTIMGVRMVAVSYSQGGVTIDVGIPIWITYIIMPVGMGLLSIYFLNRVYKAIRKRDGGLFDNPDPDRFKNAI